MPFGELPDSGVPIPYRHLFDRASFRRAHRASNAVVEVPDMRERVVGKVGPNDPPFAISMICRKGKSYFRPPRQVDLAATDLHGK